MHARALVSLAVGLSVVDTTSANAEPPDGFVSLRRLCDELRASADHQVAFTDTWISGTRGWCGARRGRIGACSDRFVASLARYELERSGLVELHARVVRHVACRHPATAAESGCAPPVPQSAATACEKLLRRAAADAKDLETTFAGVRSTAQRLAAIEATWPGEARAIIASFGLARPPTGLTPRRANEGAIPAGATVAVLDVPEGDPEKHLVPVYAALPCTVVRELTPHASGFAGAVRCADDVDVTFTSVEVAVLAEAPTSAPEPQASDFEAACRRKDWRTCNEAWTRISVQPASRDEESRAAAACAKNDGVACYAQVAHMHPWALQGDARRTALSPLDKACKLGVASACDQVARYHRDVLAAADGVSAPFRRRACELGHARACYDVYRIDFQLRTEGAAFRDRALTLDPRCLE